MGTRANQGGLCSNIFVGNWRLRIELDLERKDKQEFFLKKLGSETPSVVCLTDPSVLKTGPALGPLPTSFCWHTWHRGSIFSASSRGAVKEGIALQFSWCCEATRGAFL